MMLRLRKIFSSKRDRCKSDVVLVEADIAEREREREMLENDAKRKQSLGMREKQKVTRGVLDYSLMPTQGLCLF